MFNQEEIAAREILLNLAGLVAVAGFKRWGTLVLLKSNINSNKDKTMITQIALNKLSPSPLNVRAVSPSKQADKELLSSLKANGLLQNLVVKPAKGNKFEVIAGGRRFAALKLLSEKGDIQKTEPIACRIEDNDNATQVSLSENLKESMHPADVFLAYKKMSDEGKTPKQISEAFGKSQKEVKKLLKLSSVAPKLINAFRGGDINLDIVMAFTISDDHEKQLAVYEDIKGRHFSAYTIRQRLLETDLTSDNEMVKFVTLKTYKAAGGTTATDLFKETEYILDVGVLETLANEKLASKQAELQGDGWKWVETSVEGEYGHSKRHYKQLDGELTSVPEVLSQALTIAQQEMEALMERSYTDEWTEEDDEREEKLSEEIDKLENQQEAYRLYTVEQRQVSGAVVTFNDAGDFVVCYGYVNPADEVAAGLKEAASNPLAPSEQRAPTESNSLRVDLAHYHTQALQSETMKDNGLCFDLMVFTLASKLIGGQYFSLPMNIDGRKADLSATNDIDETKSAQVITEFLNSLDTSWLNEDSTDGQFTAFRKLSSPAKKKIMCYCTAISLSSASGCIPSLISDAVGFKLEDHWQPTAKNYFSRVKKDVLLEVGVNLTSDQFRIDHEKDKKGALASLLESMPETQGWLPESISA